MDLSFRCGSSRNREVLGSVLRGLVGEGPIPKEILELEGLYRELRVRSYSQPPYSSPLAFKGIEQSVYDNLVGVRGK